jgi:hypothetical protein
VGVAEGLGVEWGGGDEGEEAESKQAIQEKGSGAVCSGACADDIAGVVWDEDRICNRIVVGRDEQCGWIWAGCGEFWGLIRRLVVGQFDMRLFVATRGYEWAELSALGLWLYLHPGHSTPRSQKRSLGAPVCPGLV